MHSILKTGTHLSLSCNIIIHFLVQFHYIWLVFDCQKISPASTSNQMKKTAGESAEIWQMAFRLMIRYCFAEVLVPQVKNDHVQRTLANHWVHLEYVRDVTPTACCQNHFFPGSHAENWARYVCLLEIPSCMMSYFCDQSTQVSRNRILSLHPATEQMITYTTKFSPWHMILLK